MNVLLYISSTKSNKNDRKGFTIIELLIVLFLIVVVGGIGYLSLGKQLAREKLLSEGFALANDFNNVKNSAMLQGIRYALKVTSSNTYEIAFYDSLGVRKVLRTSKLSNGRFGVISGISSCPDGSAADVSDGVSFPDNEIVFLPIGVPLSSGCAIITRNPYAVAVSVNPSGQIETFVYIKGSWVKK